MTGQIAVHFIGSKLYTPEKFENEAAKHGVARAIPARWLRTLRFGDLILLAIFKGDARAHNDDGAAIGEAWGTASAFGYFYLEGLNCQAPQAFHDWLHSRLTVLEVFDRGGEEVKRECGGYSIGLELTIKEDLRDILSLAAEWQRANPEAKVKWFATGKFWPLAPHMTIEHVKFTRTISKLDIAGWDGKAAPGFADHSEGRPLAFVYDYESRRYVLKSVACVCGKRHLKPEIAAKHEARAKAKEAAK